MAIHERGYPLTPSTLWNRARDWNLSIFKSESFPNIHPCIPPFIFYSFEAHTRCDASIDASLFSLVHPIFITRTHVYTRFFFLRQVYLSRSQGGREIIKFFEYFSSRALCKIFQIFQIFSLLSFTSNLSKIEMYRNLYIYVCIHSWSGDFKRTIGKVYLQQRASYEVLKDSDGKQVGCTVARLPYFSSTFVFSFIPCSPRFKRNFLQLSYTCRSTLFTSSFTLRVCIYIYIFNKFTQRSFNLISQPAAYRSEQFLQIKGKNPFSSLSLSLFSPRVGEKLTEKCYDETRQGWRGEEKEEGRRKKYCTSLISRPVRNEKYIYA